MTFESALILIPRINEKLPVQRWFENFGSFLKKCPNDIGFRGKLSKDIADGFWSTRPKELKEMDNIFQELPHTENVGDHSYHAAMKLNTEETYNGESYFKKKPDMIKVLRTATILHDIGKRRNPANENHPYDSAQEVGQYLRWMDFNDKEIWLCLHLIAHHNIIGKVADPKAKETVDDVVKVCLGSPAILQCLWAFTKADIGSIKGIIDNNPKILNTIAEVARAADYRLRKIKDRKMYSLPK